MRMLTLSVLMVGLLAGCNGGDGADGVEADGVGSYGLPLPPELASSPPLDEPVPSVPEELTYEIHGMGVV